MSKFLYLRSGWNLNIREKTEELEEKYLSPEASLSKNTLGRKYKQDKCDIRTEYQRDRDRIIHCKSFRRLKHKTQVFISPEGDHYRTRLTHTLEVAQIARTISRALRLNEDLTEAIALGHDLGHTPFGHAGEDALNKLSPFGFKHYKQSVRVLEKIENNGKGLNLTAEVLDGILCHTSGKQAFTAEGRIVRIADRIAYLNHDIDDAKRAGVLSDKDIPAYILETLGVEKSQRINKLIHSLIENSHGKDFCMEESVQYAFDELHTFMYQNVYDSYAKAEEVKVPRLIGALYEYFIKHMDELPEQMRKTYIEESPENAVCDYIAGMTDRFAVDAFQKIFVPKSWNNW